MKKIIIFGLLIGILLLSGCVKYGSTPEPDTNLRCLMPKPTEVGYCEPVHGYYFDGNINTCKVISGCSVDGEIPFTSQQDCEKTCVK